MKSKQSLNLSMHYNPRYDTRFKRRRFLLSSVMSIFRIPPTIHTTMARQSANPTAGTCLVYKYTEENQCLQRVSSLNKVL